MQQSGRLIHRHARLQPQQVEKKQGENTVFHLGIVAQPAPNPKLGRLFWAVCPSAELAGEGVLHLLHIGGGEIQGQGKGCRESLALQALHQWCQARVGGHKLRNFAGLAKTVEQPELT